MLMALLEKRLPFREVRVDLGRKSPEFTDLYHSVMPGERRKVSALEGSVTPMMPLQHVAEQDLV